MNELTGLKLGSYLGSTESWDARTARAKRDGYGKISVGRQTRVHLHVFGQFMFKTLN